MIKPAASDFMASCGNFSNELRVLFRDPTKHKKCGLSFIAIEQVESL